MELLSVADILRRRRLLVVVGLLAAAAVAAVVGGIVPPRNSGGAQPARGEAVARVLVDMPVPLAATTTAKGAQTITQRSVLLAALMGSEAMARAIAQRSGIQPQLLAVVGPVFPPVSVGANGLLPDGELPQRAALAAQAAASQPYAVQLVTDAAVPVISIGTTAPDVRQAASLAEATVAILKSAGAENGPGRPRTAVNVEQLGAVRSARSSGSRSHHLIGVLAGVALFTVWCTAIVVASGFARMWRQAGLQAT